jgi:hypothetical protein
VLFCAAGPTFSPSASSPRVSSLLKELEGDSKSESGKKRKRKPVKVGDMDLSKEVKGLEPVRAREVLQKVSSLIKDIRYQRLLRHRAGEESDLPQKPGKRFQDEMRGLCGI